MKPILQPRTRLVKLREYVVNHPELPPEKVKSLLADVMEAVLDVSRWPHSEARDSERFIRQEVELLRRECGWGFEVLGHDSTEAEDV